MAENALIRTLGAVGNQIRTVLALEFALAGFVGVGLALAAGYSLGTWVFQVDFQLPWIQVTGSIATVIRLSTATGLLCSRGVSTAPPLKVLRGN